MLLSIHILIHFALAVLSGFLVGRYYKNIKLGIIFGIIGGFLIDLDHVLEYFLFYGLHFNLTYFLEGREFLLSDKIRLFFHAWEYIFIFLVLIIIFRKRILIKFVFITIMLAGTVHLISDCLINNYPPQNYSLIYRARVRFAMQEILSPEQYQNNMDEKAKLGL